MNKVQKFVKSAGVRRAGLIAVSVLLPIAAHATDGGSSGGYVDFSTMVAALQTDMRTTITTNGLPLLGCMLVFAIFGFIWRKIRRAIS